MVTTSETVGKFYVNWSSLRPSL